MSRDKIYIDYERACYQLDSAIPLFNVHSLVGIKKGRSTGYYKEEYEKLKPAVEIINELASIIEDTKFEYEYNNTKQLPHIFIHQGIIIALRDLGLTMHLIGRLMKRDHSSIVVTLQKTETDTYRIGRLIRQDVANYVKQEVLKRLGGLDWKAN